MKNFLLKMTELLLDGKLWQKDQMSHVGMFKFSDIHLHIVIKWNIDFVFYFGIKTFKCCNKLTVDYCETLITIMHLGVCKNR